MRVLLIKLPIDTAATVERMTNTNAGKLVARTVPMGSARSTDVLSRSTISPFKLVLVVSVVVALLAGGLWFRRQVQIDTCLDAGGRWDSVDQECEGTALP